jgi:NAD(P)-dependent dehydrogenase (short-subunit alcohol dehydrogenase family)
MELGLKGKVAFVTGGSEGIGRATAEELAREGVRVAMCGRRADVLQRAAEEITAATGGEVLAVPADVTRPEEIARCVSTIADKLGAITLLVNNAGGHAAGALEATDDAAWYADFDLKLMAAVRTSRLVVPGMRAAGGGRIVNVTAIFGKHPTAGSLPTSVNRAAGIALTKSMSKELAKDGILVNSVCIGLIKSGQMGRMAQRLFPDASLDDGYARMGSNIPVGRMGEAAEVAGLITFLLSSRGSYITGTAINVDGGSSHAV